MSGLKIVAALPAGRTDYELAFGDDPEFWHPVVAWVVTDRGGLLPVIGAASGWTATWGGDDAAGYRVREVRP